MTTADRIQAVADLLRASRSAVAFTGAGISTPSGIPDFRDPEGGLWTHDNPLKVASIHSFRQQPQTFYDWVYPLAQKILAAVPNPAHLALAELEAYLQRKNISAAEIIGVAADKRKTFADMPLRTDNWKKYVAGGADRR